MRKIIGFRTLCVGLGIWVGTVVVSAQGEFKALPWSQSTAYNSYLMRDVHRQFASRQSAIQQAFTSPAGMQEYLEGCRERYKQIVGTFSEKENLNVQVVGKIQGTGYHIEKIIFESKPGRYVTAHLYMPENTTVPVPATLELCGHGLNGKGSSSHAAMLMASNGIAVLVVDPIGQGERLQLIDREGKPLTRGATTEHTLLNAGFNLLGTSLAAQEYWDNHRALDYLLTRKDIDPERIGVYGSSGGGTQTAYYIGLDPRVKVAAICSFFSTRERTMELQGPSDGCQHIPYEGREQLEVPDFALMMAPRPLLILSGKYDFVDLWGAQQGFAELQQCYKVLGVPEKVDMLTVETGHGLGVEKRQKLVSWFKRWLKDDQSSVPNKNNWSKTALAWMSIGYETQIPPISTVTFYNAIANNGVMVKPKFVKAIMKDGQVVKEIPTEVLNPAIASPKTIQEIQVILEKVVSEGLGRQAGSKQFHVSGKTGTAQVSQGRSGYTNGMRQYLVSFCGYFPSESPRYSCIVAIQKNGYPASGGGMAGPVFRNIAERVFAKHLAQDLQGAKDSTSILVPDVKHGDIGAANYILNQIDIRTTGLSNSYSIDKPVWGNVTTNPDNVMFSKKEINNKLVPSVIGMGAKDAVYLLESIGLKTRLSGMGKVKSQSIPAGNTIRKGQTIQLRLN